MAANRAAPPFRDGCAEALGITRKTLSAILNGRAGISPDMAIRLERAFGSTARHWLSLQLSYDLWQAQQTAPPAVKRLFPS